VLFRKGFDDATLPKCRAPSGDILPQLRRLSEFAQSSLVILGLSACADGSVIQEAPLSLWACKPSRSLDTRKLRLLALNDHYMQLTEVKAVFRVLEPSTVPQKNH
jgi:hypothetical protein